MTPGFTTLGDWLTLSQKAKIGMVSSSTKVTTAADGPKCTAAKHVTTHPNTAVVQARRGLDQTAPKLKPLNTFKQLEPTHPLPQKHNGFHGMLQQENDRRHSIDATPAHAYDTNATMKPNPVSVKPSGDTAIEQEPTPRTSSSGGGSMNGDLFAIIAACLEDPTTSTSPGCKGASYGLQVTALTAANAFADHDHTLKEQRHSWSGGAPPAPYAPLLLPAADVVNSGYSSSSNSSSSSCRSAEDPPELRTLLVASQRLQSHQQTRHGEPAGVKVAAGPAGSHQAVTCHRYVPPTLGSTLLAGLQRGAITCQKQRPGATGTNIPGAATVQQVERLLFAKAAGDVTNTQKHTNNATIQPVCLNHTEQQQVPGGCTLEVLYGAHQHKRKQRQQQRQHHGFKHTNHNKRGQ